MRQQVSPAAAPPARMNGVLFALVCLLSSAFGLILFLAIGIFIAALFTIVTGITNNNIDGIIGISTAFVGFIMPTVILLRRRSSQSPASFVPGSSEANLTGQPLSYQEENTRDDFDRQLADHRARPKSLSAQELRILEGAGQAHEDRGAYSFRVRIIDWGFLLYNLLYIPILLLLVVGDVFRKATVSERHTLLFVIAAPAVFTAFHELRGTTIKKNKLTYPVRVQIYGPFAFPIFRRTINLDRATEATADTKYQNVKFSELTRLRMVYISGAFIQAKIWFSSKGRRDWLFSQIRVAAPHVRQYRGRW